MSSGYIYLLQPLWSINNNKEIYKIGKTKRNNFKRFNEYPIGSILLLQSSCKNCDLMEKHLLKLFDEQFIKETDYGREYFRGDLFEMKKLINSEIMNEEVVIDNESDVAKMNDKTETEMCGIINNNENNNEKKNKNKHNFFCEHCDYRTIDNGNYSKHLLTAKHTRITNNNCKIHKTTNKNIVCICGKEYNNRHNLSRHKKTCNYEEKPVPTLAPNPVSNVIDVSMIIDIIKENKEIKNILMEQNKMVMELQKDNNILINKLVEREPGNNNNNINSNNTINNNNNQKFNLNFFLNETCKDAMSIQEFIENIRITFQDLMTIGDAGFVNGVSDIFIKQLRDLDLTKRPIHCTDSKRETIYLKHDAAWNKDDKDKTILKQMIEKIEYRNVVALRDWCTENPDARVNNTPNNLLKDKIYLQTLQGDDKTRDKIIKNISKEVFVDKEENLTIT